MRWDYSAGASMLRAESCLRTGGTAAARARTPDTGRPTAEIYAVKDMDDPLELWWLVQQEILSRTPRWKDDYFQIVAEALVFDNAGNVFASELWVIVVFDPAGKAVTRVDYWPIFANGALDDVAYDDATATLMHGAEDR